MNVRYYTDGSYSSSTGYGGWAFVRVRGEVEEYHRRAWIPPAEDVSNNYAELMAVAKALSDCLVCSDNVIIYSDSEYALNVITGRHRVGNHRRLLDAILPVVRIMGSRVSFEWVKGHAGCRWNNKADRLATMARKNMLRL